MEIRRKIMINQRYMAVSPRGFNSESISPRGFNSLSVSPRGFNSFLILFMMAFCFSGFSQTEGKYDVIINKNSKITFTGFQLNKTQPYYGFKQYELVAPYQNVAGANNGLTLNGQTVQLGGILVQPTNINQNGFNISTNGVGNFGIGTSTPLQKLHVNGAIQFQNALMPNGNAGLIGQVLVSQGAATVPTWQTLASGWGLLGNAGTVQATNFLGTTDNVGLSLRTNNTIRQTITNTGNVGIENTNPTARFQVDNLLGAMSSVALFKNGNGSGGYAVRGESINVGAALGVYGELGVWDGTRWSGVRGNSGTSNAPAITGINTVVGGVSAYFNERVGVGTTTPTSNIHINGSEAGSITNITATTALNATHHKILVSNAAVNITITLPDALTCLGREYIFSRAAGSTGSITLKGTGTNIIQALNGTTGATTSIGLHSATGGGLRHSFTAVNIGGVGVWVRI
ncbi:MAG TPA: hypothetical protein PKD16_15370 [Saprospiraceae bacterium]|nr:hypothetical protein [Saprospiraceae bacterium]